MNVGNLTIEIWEMVIISFLFLTIVLVGVQIANPDYLKTQSLNLQVKYISYLSEDTTISSNLEISKDTKLKISQNSAEISINDVPSNTKISTRKVKIKINQNILTINPQNG